MAKGGNKEQGGNKPPVIRFDVPVVEFPQPAPEQFRKIDELIGSLPGKTFRGADLPLVITGWVNSLPDFQRLSFYQKASELDKKEDNQKNLLNLFQNLSRLNSNDERTRYVLERQLMLATDPMAAALAKLQLCLGTLPNQVPAVLVVKTQRGLIVMDAKSRSDEWQMVIQDFLPWLEDESRKNWLAKLLGPLKAQEVMSHLANIVCLPEADRLNYTATSTTGGKP